jgi:hypothetical protein
MLAPPTFHFLRSSLSPKRQGGRKRKKKRKEKKKKGEIDTYGLGLGSSHAGIIRLGYNPYVRGEDRLGGVFTSKPGLKTGKKKPTENFRASWPLK